MSVCPECSGRLQRVTQAAGEGTVQVIYTCSHCGARTIDSVVERRNERRLPLQAPVTFAAAGVLQSGELHNVSIGGFAFTTQAELQVGQQLNFRLTLEDGEIVRAAARVVWRQAQEPRFEYGCAFLSQQCPPRLAARLQS